MPPIAINKLAMKRNQFKISEYKIVNKINKNLLIHVSIRVFNLLWQFTHWNHFHRLHQFDFQLQSPTNINFYMQPTTNICTVMRFYGVFWVFTFNLIFEKRKPDSDTVWFLRIYVPRSEAIPDFYSFTYIVFFLGNLHVEIQFLNWWEKSTFAW